MLVTLANKIVFEGVQDGLPYMPKLTVKLWLNKASKNIITIKL